MWTKAGEFAKMFWEIERKEKNVEKLTEKDLQLVAAAQEAIQENYDEMQYRHTVGAAVRCKNGKIYVGVNLYSLHGACAEQIAIGTAITRGEREFDSLAVVRGKGGEEIIPPCGNCRQMLCDMMPECKVILAADGKLFKMKARELLPFPYHFEG